MSFNPIGRYQEVVDAYCKASGMRPFPTDERTIELGLAAAGDKIRKLSEATYRENTLFVNVSLHDAICEDPLTKAIQIDDKGEIVAHWRNYDIEFSDLFSGIVRTKRLSYLFKL